MNPEISSDLLQAHPWFTVPCDLDNVPTKLHRISIRHGEHPSSQPPRVSHLRCHLNLHQTRLTSNVAICGRGITSQSTGNGSDAGGDGSGDLRVHRGAIRTVPDATQHSAGGAPLQRKPRDPNSSYPQRCSQGSGTKPRKWDFLKDQLRFRVVIWHLSVLLR